MSLGEWIGDRTEYAVRYVKPKRLAGTVADVCHYKWLAEASVSRHEWGGVKVEVVQRTVTYGDWRAA